jgi:hypothetical protein
MSSKPTRELGADGETLSLRWATPGGILSALDAIEDACTDAATEPEAWELLRCDMVRSPSRGQRVSIRLTLIARSAVHRLKARRSNR